jgi:hypothetical protein
MSVLSAGLLMKTQMTLEEDLQRGGPISPLDWHGILIFRTDAAR